MKEYRKLFKLEHIPINSPFSHKPNKMKSQKSKRTKKINLKRYRNWIWTFFIGLGLMIGVYSATTITDTSIIINNSVFFINGTSGNIGIGTATPTALLDINGDMILSGGAQSYNFTNRLNTLAIQGQSSGLESLLELYTKDGDGTDELELRIFAVGTPGNITNRELFQFGYSDVTNTFDIETQASGTGVARDIRIIDDGTVWMTFQAGGNVGIGTTTPTHKLNVIGDINFTGLIYGNGSQLTSLPSTFDNTNLAYFNESVNFTRNMNLTQNISSADYINANFFVGAGTSLTSLPVDMATIKYQNISNIPTCTGSARLTFDGTSLTCSNWVNTNLVYFNETNNFTVSQQFNVNVNITGNISDSNYITADFFVGSGSQLTGIPASSITAGTFGTGNYVMDTNLTVERLVLEVNTSRHYIYDNGTCTFVVGSTSTFRVC